MSSESAKELIDGVDGKRSKLHIRALATRFFLCTIIKSLTTDITQSVKSVIGEVSLPGAICFTTAATTPK